MRISWRVFGLWIVLSAAIIAPWSFPISAPPPSTPTLAAPNSPVDQVSPFPTLATLPETTRRPLFIASRRTAPPASAKMTQDSPPAKPARLVGYRLTGIVRSSTQHMILLAEEKSGRVVELREGEQVDGWRLTSIGTNHVKLSRDGHEIDLLNLNAKTPSIMGRDTRWLPSAGDRR
jgi:hypothetical protein